MDPHATAGRIVHYYPLTEGDLEPIAAQVNRETNDIGTAQLTVFEVTGPRCIHRVAYSESPAPGCWSWMPYQKEKAEAIGGNQSESAEPRPVVELPKDFHEMRQFVGDLAENVSQIAHNLSNIANDVDARVSIIEQHAIMEDHDTPDPDQPPLTNQAGEPIAGDEEVPDAGPSDTPVDLNSSTHGQLPD